MNALDFLKQEHAKAKDKFKEIGSADPSQRLDLWEKLRPELEIHERIEKEHLYGPVAGEPQAKGTRLEEWKKEHAEEVGEVRDVMRTMDGIDPTTDEWLQNLEEVRSLLVEHIAEEENDVFPEITRIWDASRLEEAGSKMKREHDELMKEAMTQRAKS